MQTEEQSQQFCADTYRGHQMAVLNHGGGWLAYLDHVMQNRMLFASAEAAFAWLRRKIEANSPSEARS
jgi:hypothetical protein